MNNTLFLISALLLIVVIYFLGKKYGKKAPVHEEHHDHGTDTGGCCGKHAVCEKGNEGELYFDDEELDRFKGVSPDEYDESAVEEFRHILYTMKESEVDTWVQCLQARGIELPYELKEEVLMILRR